MVEDDEDDEEDEEDEEEEEDEAFEDPTLPPFISFTSMDSKKLIPSITFFTSAPDSNDAISVGVWYCLGAFATLGFLSTGADKEKREEEEEEEGAPTTELSDLSQFIA